MLLWQHELWMRTKVTHPRALVLAMVLT